MSANYYNESNNSNSFLLAILAIVIIGAVAFGVYWFSGSTERHTTNISLPQEHTRIITPAAPSVPSTPAPASPATPANQ